MKISIFCTLLFFSFNSDAQELSAVLVKEKLTIEFENGHSCMTQTRAASHEEALYTVDKCGAVKYKLSNRGKCISIYEKDSNNRWYERDQRVVSQSFSEVISGEMRYSFLLSDGSRFVYVPERVSGPLVILDLVTEDVVHFIYL